ncbi:MAG: PEGA domain-containing protein, partial [Spirochaetaceae bacterium]
MSTHAKRKPEEQQKPEPVVLKPIAGIPAEKYVPGLFIAVILAVLFWLFFIPGITNYGSEVIFDSFPANAAVYADNQYLGATPFAAKLTAGEHTIKFESQYYESKEKTIEVRGRLFGSRFFPRRQNESAQLELNDHASLAKTALAEYADWAIVGQESSRYRFPAILRPAVHRLMLSGNKESAEHLLHYALSHASTSSLVRDYVSAALRMEGGIPSGSNLIKALGRLSILLNSSEESVLWLADVLPSALQKNVKGRPDFIDLSESIATRLITSTSPHGFGPEGLETKPVIKPENLNIRAFGQDLQFVAVPETTYLYGASSGSQEGEIFPYISEVKEFFLQKTPVTKAQYSAMLAYT